MKTSSSWIQIQRSHRDQPPPTTDLNLSPSSSGFHQQQKPPSPFKGLSKIFNRKSVLSLNRTLPTTSLQPGFPTSSSTLSLQNTVIHPYATMSLAPLPVVSSHDATEDEDECPVCLEPLSFSFRLRGEKPHIVPECGHALHEACFNAVYGPPPGQAKSTVPRKTNLGVCGVCRRPMKVGDGDSGKSNKLAALTGMGDRNAPGIYPGRDTPSSLRNHNNRGHPVSRPYDPTEDDPVEHTGSVRSNQGGEPQLQYIVAPSIQVRPEFSSLTRNGEPTQLLTCIVVIELPGKRNTGNVPGRVMPDSYAQRIGHSRHDTSLTEDRLSIRDQPSIRQRQYSSVSDIDAPSRNSHSQGRAGSRPSPTASDPTLTPTWTDSESALHAPSTTTHDSESPFSAITEDLRNRIIDWKGHPLSGLGPLKMYDLLSVRRDALVREFFVYLFSEAIICIVEEKKRSFGRLLSNASSFTDSGSMVGVASSSQSKGVLRLKGRIYVRHIKQVTASSSAGEMSLTIDMEDERLDSFILIFKDKSSLESWKNQIQTLVSAFQQRNPPPPSQSSQFDRGPDLEEFGGSAKAARILSGSTSTSVSTDSLLNSGRSTMSSSTSHGSTAPRQMQHKLSPLGEDDEISPYESSTVLVTPHLSSGPSNSLTPLPHPPLDLILVISVPPPTAVPSTAALKVRVIKASLDFLLASLGAKDRLSLVTFEVGIEGQVRKTPFLCVGRAQSRARLARFIDGIGMGSEEASLIEDEFLVRGSKDEKTDVVTAVNHGLDVVLQRKSRNPISGMVLVSDASDSTRRAQMDLVLARAEAANVAIHSFGYGRSHDPASLWLMSNHTSGTYTFVKDWYDLRDCIAGCVGGMMSIGLLNMKLHMKVVDGHRFRIRKVSGGPSSIVASDGHDVDVDVGELRYGERKEMLIELELDNGDVSMKQPLGKAGTNRTLNATDQFVQSMGLDSLSIGDADLADGMIDRMIDEVPVFEVDGSFFDPAAAKHVSRLAHPVLLTVTLLPMTGSRPPTNPSDPVIVRRRMELLASDMITRALVLVSRKNFPQAQKIMSETKRILHTVLQTISRTLPAPNSNGGTIRRKEILTLGAVRAMQAILQDMQILSEALEENKELFAHDQRNFGAQQAMILRDQKSWSGRSATERLFWTTDNSIELVSRSTDWIARD